MNAQTVIEIKNTVATVFNVDPAHMNAGRRSRAYARPRQVAMMLTRELTDMSLPAIARAFCFNDHTTVLHAVNRVRELAAADPAFMVAVDLARMRYQVGNDNPQAWTKFRLQLGACVSIGEFLRSLPPVDAIAMEAANV